MERVRTVKVDEELGGSGSVRQTQYEFAAPDRMHALADDGAEYVVVGNIRYFREGKDKPWQAGSWAGPKPFSFPVYRYVEMAQNPMLLEVQDIGGIPYYRVAFRDESSDAYFEVLVGARDFLTNELRMLYPGHYMRHRFYDYDVRVDIQPPPVGVGK